MRISTGLLVAVACGIHVTAVHAADLDPSNLQPVSVGVSAAKEVGDGVVRVTKDPAVTAFDEATFAKLKGVKFRDGTIEVKVRSRLLDDAPEFARGFIGVAFRVADDDSKFECIYVRPANGRAEQQIQRNHTTQYFSYPDFKFERLRKEAAGHYESYADIALDEWIDLRIEVKGARAKLFIGDAKQPSLIVNDLKHGADAEGGIGLFVDVGTEGFFKELKVRHD